MPSLIYLDHNATAPLLPEVARAMHALAGEELGNPSSQHAPGRRARRLLEDAAERIAGILGANLLGPAADRLILASGGTEANNLFLLGLSSPADSPGEGILSAIEHPSVQACADWLGERGWRIHRLRVGRDGVVDLNQLADLLNPATRWVSIMLANNETGVIQPVEKAAALCRAAGVPFHTDAAQAAGKIPVDFRRLDVDALSLAAHKFHGPVGIGALLIRSHLTLAPLMHGGGQQSSLRPGTESVILAAGMRAALESWEREGRERTDRLGRLRDRLEGALREALAEIVIHGAEAIRLPHVTNVGFAGHDRQALFMALDTAGVACSTGSACASGASEPSPVLTAMGAPRETARGALRFSLGATTTEAEIDQAAERIIAQVRRLSSLTP